MMSYSSGVLIHLVGKFGTAYVAENSSSRVLESPRAHSFPASLLVSIDSLSFKLEFCVEDFESLWLIAFSI